MSGEAKHTPGPWQIAMKSARESMILGPPSGKQPPSHEIVALVPVVIGYGRSAEDASHANAALIAAAPDLLAALHALLDASDEFRTKGHLSLNRAHALGAAAIAKAEGR